MLTTKNSLEKTGNKLIDAPDLIKDGLEEELDSYTRSAVSNIRFNVVIKPAIISLVALIVSFFLDVSTVPLLGDITFDLARNLFPGWEAPIETFEPFSFWWLPIFAYALFIFISYLAYNKLKIEIIRTPASETIDRLIEASASVIDSIATALPLIGAAILLISITLGEEIFLGLSVPFEIKALIVLAIGKLFIPVLDQLGVEFQNVVNHVRDIRDKYFSRIQIESSKSLLKQVNQSGLGSTAQMSATDVEKYRSLVEDSAKLSEVMRKNYSAVSEMMEKINSMQQISSDKIQQLSALANSVSQASNSLTDERTLTGLKHLEAIVKK
ncbi:MAG: hypothetical protein KJN64_09340 [Ignavibacteria bacterium]|nr:hypothetical protein [Ignavibacteria bacterium]MBT8382962.1 hypothetical protein [Ignavibacteria bacterium]MBT8391080.1 hypothetical protein [Ignavibacteria bacterium]NNJ54445.1 hypothetical protein [Ignavibacteriaceae bacterium]